MFFYWHERKLYPFLGSLLLAFFLFFNFYDGHLIHLFVPFSWLQPSMAFVHRNATHFHVADPHRNASLPFYINGWNSYWFLEELSSGAPDSRAKVSRMLRKGREMGMEVCRTWAFSDGGVNALQISPGKFDPGVFEALDYVIYEARRNRVWLILSLVNNLSAFGGKEQYVKWAKAAGVNVSNSGDEFFSDHTIKGYYRNYVKAILSRKNSYSGVRYSDEPAIFAWELVNEPRCASNLSAPLLQAWIVEMASYIKSLDKNHLVTVGLEGFYGPGWSERAMTNPGEWAASLGSDFIQNSAIADIDFASVHAYPDSWLPNATLEEKATYLAHWVDAHVNDSEHILKKPVLFTEVGSYLNTKSQGLYDRDVLLKAVYERLYKSAKEGRAGAGAFIWQLMVEGTLRFGDQFSLVAKDHPTTYTLIVQQSCRLRYMLSGANNRKQKIEWPCDGVQL